MKKSNSSLEFPSFSKRQTRQTFSVPWRGASSAEARHFAVWSFNFPDDEFMNFRIQKYA
jgi:hypothetical protein